MTRAALLLNLAVLAGLVGCDDPVTPAPGASPEVVEAVTAPDPEPSQVCVVRRKGDPIISAEGCTAKQLHTKRYPNISAEGCITSQWAQGYLHTRLP